MALLTQKRMREGKGEERLYILKTHLKRVAVGGRPKKEDGARNRETVKFEKRVERLKKKAASSGKQPKWRGDGFPLKMLSNFALIPHFIVSYYYSYLVFHFVAFSFFFVNTPYPRLVGPFYTASIFHPVCAFILLFFGKTLFQLFLFSFDVLSPLSTHFSENSWKSFYAPFFRAVE